MAPCEPKYLGSCTASCTALAPLHYIRTITNGGLADENHTWKEANQSEDVVNIQEPVAHSAKPFSVSPRRRIKEYTQAVKCRLTVYRSEVRFAERKLFMTQ